MHGGSDLQLECTQLFSTELECDPVESNDGSTNAAPAAAATCSELHLPHHALSRYFIANTDMVVGQQRERHAIAVVLIEIIMFMHRN